MGQRVLITGCSSGIGRACVEVIATARKAEDLSDIDSAVATAQLDVTDEHSVARARRYLEEVEVLINNAGTSLWGPVEEVPIREAIALFDTNVWGALRVYQAVAPGMRRRGNGRIVNVSSLAANSCGAMLGFYSASKAALSRLSDAMRVELEPYGVQVSAIELAGVESNFPQNRTVHHCSDPGYGGALEAMQRQIAERRSGSVTSEQVARWILDILREDKPSRRYVASLDGRLTGEDSV
jgi:short-subunit dehydrogenase